MQGYQSRTWVDPARLMGTAPNASKYVRRQKDYGEEGTIPKACIIRDLTFYDESTDWCRYTDLASVMLGTRAG
jgi:hypothetical protein